MRDTSRMEMGNDRDQLLKDFVGGVQRHGAMVLDVLSQRVAASGARYRLTRNAVSRLPGIPEQLLYLHKQCSCQKQVWYRKTVRLTM